MDTASMDAVDLFVENMKCESCIDRVQSALEGLPGVESVEARIGSARIVFYPQMTSPRVFRERLGQLGYPAPASGADKKGIIGRWIDRMIASNQSTFGTGTLDCCKLNRKKPG